jgi:DeoR/GlpR family transcriptional regulator of sugar metabolism
MLQASRNEFILRELHAGRSLKVADLSARLGVSVDTVRRDLKALDAAGQLKYVRGGACLPDTMLAFSGFSGREIANADLKRAAASKAALLVKKGQVVALNSGTTNAILAAELSKLAFPFTVVTNNIAAASALMGCPEVRLFCIGGMVDGTERSTCGSQCVSEFSEYIPDIAFLSLNAVSIDSGFTDFRLSEIPVIRALARGSKRVCAVMDSTKLNRVSKKRVLGFGDVDLLVTDDPKRAGEIFRSKGLSVE